MIALLLWSGVASGAVGLTWAPEGGSLLLEGSPEVLACGRLRLDVGSLVLTPEPPGQAAPGDGGRVVIAGGAATWRGTAGEVVTTALPPLLPPIPGDLDRWAPTLGAWLDARTYLWCQHDDYEGGGGCALLHPAAGRAEVLPAGGLDPYAAWDLRPGPAGWLAVFRSLEGHLDVEMLRRAGTGFAPSGLPMPSLYDSGPLEVHYPGDGTAVWLVTPCPLAERPEGHPCMGLEGVPVFEMGTPWRWYTWKPGQPALKLARADLPAGAAPAPDGTTLAWATDDLVCIGDPAHPETARCTYLPKKLPAGEECPGERAEPGG